jgi:hypothetical protein
MLDCGNRPDELVLSIRNSAEADTAVLLGIVIANGRWHVPRVRRGDPGSWRPPTLRLMGVVAMTTVRKERFTFSLECSGDALAKLDRLSQQIVNMAEDVAKR